jgi:simple sugar transport system substrate-binding protein
MIQMAKLKRGDKVIIYGLKSQPVRGQCDVGAEKIFTEAGLKVIYQEISEEVNADMTLAVPVMVGLLTANPDAKAFMGIHGGVTAVAKEALVAAGRKPSDVTFGGIDLSPKIIEGIKEGYVDIVIDQQIYLQGYLPVEQVCLTKLYGFSGLHVNTGSGFVTTENIKVVEPLIKKGIR